MVTSSTDHFSQGICRLVFDLESIDIDCSAVLYCDQLNMFISEPSVLRACAYGRWRPFAEKVGRKVTLRSRVGKETTLPPRVGKGDVGSSLRPGCLCFPTSGRVFCWPLFRQGLVPRANTRFAPTTICVVASLFKVGEHKVRQYAGFCRG